MPSLKLPPLRPAVRRVELEELLAGPREQAPDLKSLQVLVAALQKTLDRQYSALEASDRKAGVLLGVILGIGVLSADRLRTPAMPALIVFAVAVVSSLSAIFASLWVLWSRTLLTGPNPIRSAQATSWPELPYTQSVADSLAVAAQENAGVNEVKGVWLNVAFTMATIAVISFMVLSLIGGTNVTHEEPAGGLPAPAASEQPSAPAAPSDSLPAASDAAPAESPASSEGAFVHPRLGVAELREGWDPNSVPEPAPPPAEGDTDV